MPVFKDFLAALRAPLIGILISLLLCTLLLVFLGESPSVLVEAIQNTLFTQFGARVFSLLCNASFTHRPFSGH